MEISRIDPISDGRWRKFADDHPDAGIFHTPEWLAALRLTYGYEPIVYAGMGLAQQILCGIPFCRVNSFLTGRRLVSLPFSDHCQPLVDSEAQLVELLETVRRDVQEQRLKYAEIRPIVSDESRIRTTGHSRSDVVLVHTIDLVRGEAELLKSFHKKSIRSEICRSERENLQYDEGESEELLEKFYGLLLLTRRRHRLPPQPLAWFRNLIECLDGRLRIHIASKDGIAIASIVTLWFKNTVTYKYSCSDPKFNSLGGTVFLLWRSMQAAKRRGLTVFDMGRSDYNAAGLIAFKEHWGAARHAVNYYRYPEPDMKGLACSRWIGAGKRLLAITPDPMFTAIGGLLYRHAG